jgi:hypothetical protein
MPPLRGFRKVASSRNRQYDGRNKSGVIIRAIRTSLAPSFHQPTPALSRREREPVFPEAATKQGQRTEAARPQQLVTPDEVLPAGRGFR